MLRSSHIFYVLPSYVLDMFDRSWICFGYVYKSKKYNEVVLLFIQNDSFIQCSHCCSLVEVFESCNR